MAGTALLSSSPSSAMMLGKKRSIHETEDDLAMDVAFSHSSSSSSHGHGFSNFRGTAAAFDDNQNINVDDQSFLSHGTKRYKTQSHENVSPAKSSFRFSMSNGTNKSIFDDGNHLKSSPLATIHFNKMTRIAAETETTDGNYTSKFCKIASEQPPSGRELINQQKYYESLIVSLRTELDMKLAQKQAEIEELRCSQSELQRENEQLRAYHKQNAQQQEENKILKKAVAIQDVRYKELSAQFEQQQQLLRSAMGHIAEVERVNRDLTTQMNLMQYGGLASDGFNHPPPDVF